VRAVLARLLDGSRFQEFKAQVTTAGAAGMAHTSRSIHAQQWLRCGFMGLQEAAHTELY
jgi:hypothetical protein